MRNFKAISLVLIAAMAASFSVASVAADKVAVVDIATAIFSSNAAQNSIKQAQTNADFVALKAKFESSVADLQSMAKEAETKRLTWSQEQVQSHQKKMEYAKADAELARQKIQGEQKQLEQQIMQELGPVAQEALTAVVKEEGVTILLRADAVLIAGQESNLTAKVADRLNKMTK
ncbi:MAG: OmpH family outer membrane protein [Porticoccaceae bacterium]|nr:OmpH family outer membrane protein [Porticoccaceae bacterium]